MKQRLAGKTALVTGAAQGIGKAIALALAAEGARVIAADVNPETLAQLAVQQEIETLQLNVLEPEAIVQAAQHYPDINVLVNCAGVVKSGTLLDCEPADWEISLQLNVTSIYHMIRAFLPGMLARSDGNIINIASIVSSIKGAPNRFAYGASKAALIGLTKSVAIDYIRQGIRCNAICPGTVDSPSLHQRLAATGDFDQAMADFIARQPMGRIGMAEEIAALAVMLASDECAFMTGSALPIDGGWSI